MDAIASKSISSINLSIYRYDPDSGKKPYMQDLSIDIPEGQDIMVLDLLNMAKEQDPSISFRRSCGCLLYTSPSPRDATLSRMPSSA